MGMRMLPARSAWGEASSYLESRVRASRTIAIATFMCIVSPIPLILLGAASEYTKYGISENTAGAVGLITLLVVVAAAVGMFIFTGFKNAPYEFLEKEPFENEYGVAGMVREKKKAFSKSYALFNIIGTVLCIISPIPLFIGAFAGNDMLVVEMLAVLLIVAGTGVVFFISAGVRMESMQRLLKEGEFLPKDRRSKNISSAISTVFWLVATAVYLGLSFATDNWKTSWIVWPVAGVLYAAVITLCNLLVKRDDK